MNTPLKVLHVEDSERDAALLTRHLERAGFSLISERVETREAMREALTNREWDVILSDHSMPHFDALGALALLKETGLDIPFIIISGTVGEEIAVEAMKAGASDYLMKDNLTRLAPTIERELREAENRRARRLAERQVRLQATALQAAANAIVITDGRGRIIWVNPAFTSLTGYSREEVLGQNPRILKSGEHDASFYKALWDTVLSGQVWHGDMINRRKDGGLYFEEQTITPVRDEAGEITNFIAIKQDVTEYKRAEEALRESEERYKGLVDSAFDGVVIHQDRIIIDANRAYAEMFGYTVEELIGRDVLELAPPEQREYVSSVITAGKVAFEATGLKKDGTHIYVEVSPTYCEYEGKPVRMAAVRNITDRKRAEEALRESEERYRLLFENNPQPMWVFDLETLFFLAVNEAAIRHYGYTREEFLAMTVKDIRPPEGVPALMRRLTAPVAGLDEAGVWRHRKQDGSLIDVEITTHRLTFAGRPAEMVLVNDVTERLKAEAALIEAEEKYRSIFENAVEGIFQTLPEGKWVSANPAMAQMLGYESPQELMTSITDFERQLYVEPNSRAEYRKLLEERGLVRGFEIQYRRKDGSRIWASVSTRAVRDASGALVSYEGFVEDITERKQVEEELRKSEERYRDLVENAHDIIYSHDLEGNYTSVNNAGEKITGYTREEALRMNLMQTVAPEYHGKVRELIARKLAGETVTAYELEVIAKDGRRVALEVNTKLVFQDGVAVGVQGIARDITERKQLEEQLRQSQKLEAVGQLAGGIAHDFNNLLTAINGYSELALMKLKQEDPLHHNLEEIKKSGDRAANLTRQLLAFSRKQVLQPKVLVLNSVVADIEKMLRRIIGEDVNLRASLEPALGSVKADPGQIEQVIMNLAVNARDAMPAGGKLTIETANIYLDEGYAREHVAVIPGRYVMLAVSDTGTGMDAATRARIFEPFFTTKEAGKGTGLGLSTVYGIVKQSGGNVWVYSEVGRGTTFKVYLPRVDEDAEEYKGAVETEEVLRGTETVLLAEDEDVVRALACEVLETYGYRVLEAAGGGAALLICERETEPIDLLITDVVMPELSGRQLAERLKQLRPDMRVLYMSGYTDNAIVHQGVLNEGANFIQKPFAPAALARKVREVLDKLE